MRVDKSTGLPIVDEQQRQSFIASLRGLADFLESHKHVPAPLVSRCEVAFHPDDQGELLALMAALDMTEYQSRSGGDADSGWCDVIKTFGHPLVRVRVSASKSRCFERVQVGEEPQPPIAKYEYHLPGMIEVAEVARIPK